MAMEEQSLAPIIVERIWDVRRPLSFVNGMVGNEVSGVVRALSRAIVGHAVLVRDRRKLLVRCATKALKSRRFAPLHPFASSVTHAPDAIRCTDGTRSDASVQSGAMAVSFFCSFLFTANGVSHG